ncbi:hypothetical protein H8959_007052 [Pygathrix nigripes]
MQRSLAERVEASPAGEPPVPARSGTNLSTECVHRCQRLSDEVAQEWKWLVMLWLLHCEGLLVLLASGLRVAHSPLQLPRLPQGSCCKAGLERPGNPSGKEAGPKGEQHAGSAD